MHTTFTVLGILLTLAGSAIVVVAAIRVPRLLQLPDFQFGHMRRVEELRTARRRGYDNFPEKEREAAYAAAEKSYEEDKQEVERGITHDYYADKAQALRTNAWGISLIAAGSVAQGIGALIA